ncbi:MAG TPA: Ig-like domain-containing protein [Solirubrobacterales bacterium]|nr:Ig-like domain-containing protein [Solirubrobacterales bacterium]
MRITGFAARIALLSALICVAAVPFVTAASARSKPAAHSSPRLSGACAKQAARAKAAGARASRVKACLIAKSSAAKKRDNAAPSVAWQAPLSGATVKGTLEGAGCQVSASDNRGIASVVFRLDGAVLNTELSAPYNCGFDTTKVSNGTHTLTATAYDAAGNSRSASIGVLVANSTAPAPPTSPETTPTTPETTPTTPETTPSSPESTPVPGDTAAPAVAWQLPAAGSVVKGTVQGAACEVSASDDRGVAKVVFTVDGTALNTESSAPWNCSFDTTKVADGTHTLTATAYDAAGNSSSAARTVTVSNAVVTPPPTETPPTSSGMIVGLDSGNYGSGAASDVRNAVNTVRYDVERGVSTLENFKKAGLRIQMLFPGPYNSGGVCALNASNWVSETLSFYKANTNPTQTPIVEALNEPGGSWFWGSNAASTANATCYRELLKKTYTAFHNQYGSQAPKILGTLDGSGGLAFGKAWVTSDWSSYVDGFIVHPYGGTGSRTNSALGNRSLIESAHALTGGPVYVTEVGWPTATGQPATGDSLQWSETEQATNITNFLTWCHGTGYVNEVIYFNYRDFGSNNWYGIERADGTKKPSYSALKQAAEKYGI